MCSIYGAIGQVNETIMNAIRDRAGDRGRDGGRVEYYKTTDGHQIVLGNWRATPTPEVEVGPLQPYDRLVHNGTIANDKELGAQPGEIDSQVLARVLDRSSIDALVQSLRQVRGSYALAMATHKTVLAAVNYKPLSYALIGNAVYFSSMPRHFQDVMPFGHDPVPLAPYTAIDFRTQEILSIHKEDAKRVVVVASAGLDSTVVATQFVREGWEVCLLHFGYGCQASGPEYRAIPKIADALQCRYAYLEVDLASMLKGASTLFGKTSDIAPAVAGAEYAHEWVPGRNLVFIALATAWAEAHGYHAVASGTNLEEGGAFPDNTEPFTDALSKAIPYAVQAHYGMRLLSPVGNLMKKEIVALGLQLGAPFEHTWSCYRGGDRHCGQCGPCLMRHEGFKRAGAADPVFCD